MSDDDAKSSLDSTRIKDELVAFWFGVDDSIEREILRYIYKCRGVANYNMIFNNIVLEKGYCARGRLIHRLDSLVSFGFLRKEEYKGTIFYEINREEIENSKMENKT